MVRGLLHFNHDYMLSLEQEVERAENELSKGTSPFHKVTNLSQSINIIKLTGILSSWAEPPQCSYELL